MNENCPCGRDQSYANCCQPIHLGQQTAADAETLMRSRYSAFVKHDIDYLLNTLHPDKRQPVDRQTLQGTCQRTQWLGLKIIDFKAHQNTAEVEFIAFYDDKPIGQLHERSRFVFENDRWLYVDGDLLPAEKISRNAVCFCGSGDKFKRCHGR